jgi:hypothetical protein
LAASPASVGTARAASSSSASQVRHGAPASFLLRLGQGVAVQPS